MSIKNYFPLICAFFSCIGLKAQQQKHNMEGSSTPFCNPKLDHTPRPKGIIFRSVQGSGQKLQSSRGDASVQRHSSEQIALRAPILAKEHFKVGLSLRYSQDEFEFHNPSFLENPIHRQLEEKSLKRLSSSLYLIKTTQKKRYYIFRSSFSASGDYANSGAEGYATSFSLSPLVGWRKNDKVSFATGLHFSYRRDRKRVYPVFVYNRNFDKHWGLESTLPLYTKLRYGTLDRKNYVYAAAALKGNQFNVDIDPSLEGPTLFREISIQYTLTLEREIHDWLWCSAEVGWNNGLHFSFENENHSDFTAEQKHRSSSNLIYGLSVFIVPPRKLMH